MPQIQEAFRLYAPLATYLRPLVIAAIWLSLVTLTSCCFFAPRGAEVQPTINDAVGFGCSTAIAGAAAATAAFAMGGRRRWAVELALAVTVLSSIAALLFAYFVWFDPTFARQQMDPWSLLRLQDGGAQWAEQLAGYHGPLGMTVGIVLGIVAGLLTVLGRPRPRLAMGTALVILFVFASDLGRQIAFDQVTWLGRLLRYFFVRGSISDDQISISGIIFGAIAGAVIATIAMYATRPQAGASELNQE